MRCTKQWCRPSLGVISRCISIHALWNPGCASKKLEFISGLMFTSRCLPVFRCFLQQFIQGITRWFRKISSIYLIVYQLMLLSEYAWSFLIVQLEMLLCKAVYVCVCMWCVMCGGSHGQQKGKLHPWSSTIQYFLVSEKQFRLRFHIGRPKRENNSIIQGMQRYANHRTTTYRCTGWPLATSRGNSAPPSPRAAHCVCIRMRHFRVPLLSL